MPEQKRRSHRESKKTKDDGKAARKKKAGPGYMDRTVSQPVGPAKPGGQPGKRP